MSEDLQNETVEDTTEEVTNTEEVKADYSADEDELPTQDNNESYKWVLDKYKSDSGEFDSDKVAKAYAELTNKLSDKGMLAPDDVNGYEFELSDETLYDDEAIQETKEFFKEIDLPAKYAQPLAEQYEKRVSEVIEHYEKELENNDMSKFTADNTASELEKDWGKDFDTNLVAANKAIETYFEGDISEYKELANNPVFAKIMAKVGADLTEDTAPAQKQVSTNLTEEEVDLLMSKDDYWEPDSPSYKKVQEYFNSK